MAKKNVKLWYDREGDYLEVLFEKKAGFFVKPQMINSWKKSMAAEM